MARVALSVTGTATLAWCVAIAPLFGMPASHQAAPAARDRMVRQRVGFTSYGAVRIGMTREALAAALGGPLQEDDMREEGCSYVSERGSPGVACMLLDGRLARIDVFGSSRVRAFAGGGIGTSKAELQTLYRAIKVEPHFYDDTGFYLTSLSKDGRYGIRFEIEDGRVSSYYAGLAEAIQYVEGCE